LIAHARTHLATILAIGMALLALTYSGAEAAGNPTGCLPGSLKNTLSTLRAKFGPISIVSTHRPGARIAGTRKRSLHASCRAVDFHPPRGKYQAVLSYLLANHNGGVGTYGCAMHHIHIDNGPRVRYNHCVNSAGLVIRRLKPQGGTVMVASANRRGKKATQVAAIRAPKTTTVALAAVKPRSKKPVAVASAKPRTKETIAMAAAKPKPKKPVLLASARKPKVRAANPPAVTPPEVVALRQAAPTQIVGFQSVTQHVARLRQDEFANAAPSGGGVVFWAVPHRCDATSAAAAREAWQVVEQFEPGQLLFAMYMRRGNHVGRLVERAEIEMHLARKADFGLVGDRRSAAFARGPQDARRAFVAAQPTGHRQILAPYTDEGRDRGRRVPPAALAMAVGHPQRRALEGILNATTQAAAGRRHR
jgi:hypothetical protein